MRTTSVRGLGALVGLAALVGCGSRSALLDVNEGGGGGGATCGPPVVTAACAPTIAQASPGTEVWSASFDLGDLTLLGPVAADLEGGTYYVGAEGSLYVRKALALDACGAVRWEADVSEYIAASGYVPQVMVVGGKLLLVGIGNIVALDLVTGAHVWTADLNAFAEAGGLGVSPGKVIATGFTAARSDGTVFTTIANDADLWVVTVDSAGAIAPVAAVKSYYSTAGYPLYAQQLVLDAAGDVVLAGGANWSSGEPIRAIAPGGDVVFSGELPGWGIGASLAAGPDYVAGRGLWIVGLDGTLRNSYPGGGVPYVGWDAPVVIDADGGLYAVGEEQLEGQSSTTYDVIGRFSPAGDPIWSVKLGENILAGPVLGDDGEVFVATATGFDAGSAAHLWAIGSDGTTRWATELGPSGKMPTYWLLQAASGALTLVADGKVRAFATGSKPATCAHWPTPRGDLGQRACARGL
ncbi:MAG: PQQ-binding-like beta-propeller repeat protein [Polyangiaceae bacterium]